MFLKKYSQIRQGMFFVQQEYFNINPDKLFISQTVTWTQIVSSIC